MKFLKCFTVARCSQSSGRLENYSIPASHPYFLHSDIKDIFTPGPSACSQGFWGDSFFHLTALFVVFVLSLVVPVYGVGNIAHASTTVDSTITVASQEINEGDDITYTATIDNDKVSSNRQYTTIQVRGPSPTLGGYRIHTFSVEIPPNQSSVTGKVKTHFDGMDLDVTVTLSIVYTAPGQLDPTITSTVTVTVTDGDDPVNHVPIFAEGPGTSRSFLLSDVPADVGAPVTATDANSDSLTYSLEGPDAGSFEIVSNTGQIRTIEGRAYRAGATYSVTVKADDGKGGIAMAMVTISEASPTTPTPNPLQSTPNPLQSTPNPLPPSSPSLEEEEVCAVSGVTDDESLRMFVECAASRVVAAESFAETLSLLEEFRDGEGDWNDGSVYLVLLTARGGVYFHANDRGMEDLKWSGFLSCDDEEDVSVLETQEGCFIDYNGERNGYAHPFSASHVPLAHGEENFVLLGGFNGTPMGESFTEGEVDVPSTGAGEVDTDEKLREFVGEVGRVLGEAVKDPDIDPAQLRGVFRAEGPWREGDIHVYIVEEMGRVIFDGASREREQKDESARPYVVDLLAGAGEEIVEYADGDVLIRGYALRVEIPLDEGEDSRVYIVGSGYLVQEQAEPGTSGGGGGCAVGSSSSGTFSMLFLTALMLSLPVFFKRRLE